VAAAHGMAVVSASSAGDDFIKSERLSLSFFVQQTHTHSALLFKHVFIFARHFSSEDFSSFVLRWLAGCRVCRVLLWSEKAALTKKCPSGGEKEKSRQEREGANNIYPALLFCLRRGRK
jgi:hypothetical protein